MAGRGHGFKGWRAGLARGKEETHGTSSVGVRRGLWIAGVGYAATPRVRAMVSPNVAGLSATLTPAAFRFLIFASAVSSPPLTIAPACPILLPGGAVRPAMNAVTGLRTFPLMNAAASLSSLPPISPIR